MKVDVVKGKGQNLTQHNQIDLASLGVGQHLLTRKPVRCVHVTEVSASGVVGKNLATSRKVTLRDSSKIVRLLADDDPVVLENSMLTSTAIKERGWTDRMIELYLAQPCKLVRNPGYRTGRQIRVWALSRVIKAERSVEEADMREILTMRQVRSKAAMEVADRKRQRTFREVDAINVKLVELPQEELVQRACDHYNSTERRSLAGPATPECEQSFLDRICVNYLRHQLTDYDMHLEQARGKVGRSHAQEMIREKVYDAISDCYPYLSFECDRQLFLRMQ